MTPTFEFSESLDIVFKMMLGTRKHACVLVDENGLVLGTVSLTQIFAKILEMDCDIVN